MRVAAVALGLILGACAGLPVPTPTDAERARGIGRETTVEALTAGRAAYVSRCGACHQHYHPSEHAASAWPELVDAMRERAKLDDEMRARILEYLVVLSGAPSS